jgi:hypothetical protein
MERGDGGVKGERRMDPAEIIKPNPNKISGKTEMPFGKHRGERLGSIPADYLLWLYDRHWLAEKFPTVHRYIDQERERLEKEAERDRGGC